MDVLTSPSPDPNAGLANLKLNTSRPRQNGHHFADDIFKCVFLNENIWISINISLNLIPKGQINNIPLTVQIMAWRRPGDKPVSEQWWLVYWRIFASLGLNALKIKLKTWTRQPVPMTCKTPAPLPESDHITPGSGDIHYRQKIWNIFYFSDFFHFWGVCRVFLNVKYISTNRYYFWGS